MADALKHFYSPDLVRRLAGDIRRVAPSFPSGSFTTAAVRGLDELELLDRARHIASALADSLPEYPEAVEILLRSLGPEHAKDELVGVGMEPFFYMPHSIFVAERGLDHFELSMRAQYELTKRFSAESSIRPYIAKYPERTFALLQEWASDSNAHVRRLVSEGTRLRLPWASRVAWLDANPRRVLELLERLKDDHTTLVRRSVANNLNDMSKVHGSIMIETCARWLEGATAERRALVEHALRSSMKRRDPDALRLLGYGGRARVELTQIRFDPPRVQIGGRVELCFVLRSRSSEPQELLVDLAVHFVKAGGRTSPKVFKLTRAVLQPRESIELKKSVSLAVHSTRMPRPGRHAVDVVVNGTALPAGSFDVVPTRAVRRPR